MKVICPMHNDHEPSMKIYGEWAYCFVCQAQMRTTDLNLPGSAQEIREKKHPTNVPNMIEYIKSLPQMEIRGHKFHVSDSGYYFLWPHGNFYKKRNFDDSKGRYVSPRGVSKPLFVYPGSAKHLLIVEGEINAMSLHTSVFGEYKVCSPGPAADFVRYIKYYLQFKHITIFVDKDAPGVIYGTYLKDILLRHNKHTKLVAMERDYNEIHVTEGETGVRNYFEKEMQ